MKEKTDSRKEIWGNINAKKYKNIEHFQFFLYFIQSILIIIDIRKINLKYIKKFYHGFIY